MDVIDQARRYIAKIDPAVSGANGHGKTYHVAAILVEGFALSRSDARALLTEYSQRCQPPWSEREIEHKLDDAERKSDPAKRGKLIRKGVRYRMSAPAPKASPAPVRSEKPKAARYDVSEVTELPDPIPDGARELIRAAFLPGEGIRIAVARTGDDGREVPKDSGVTLSREEWIKKLDAHKGNPNAFLKTSEKNGIFVSLNPMKLGGSRDADVTEFRHALLEFDDISREEQWGIITQSRVPCTAIISSGRKSIHAWVRVDAKDRREFDDRVKALYAHFADYRPDEKNKNPSRFSRLPNCERGASRQELLALNVGCESFPEWLALNEVDSLGKAITPADLESFNPADDENNLLGNRWLCKGMACLLIGPSGVGKSSLNIQLAVTWAVGKPAYGITPVKPLKSLVIQAENDLGDLAEMFQGVCHGLGIEPLSDEWTLLHRNIVFRRDNSHTGWEFCQVVQRLIERHKPDLIWLDPILSFVGADVSRQEVVGQFFRNWLNPILDATGVACFCIHHTGKPPSDSKSRQHWQTSDYAYAGLGSSEITNWARAVMTLQDRGHGLFELKLSKRGARAGIVTPEGLQVTSLWLRHSSQGHIFWEQTEAPEPEEKKEGKGGRPSKIDRLVGLGLGTVIDGLKEPVGLNELARRIEDYASGRKLDVSLTVCKEAVSRLVETGAIKKTEGKYVKS